MSETSMKKQALLIGINKYQILPELKYARQDAEAVELALKQNYCFSDNEVLLLTDAKSGLLNPTSWNIILKQLEKLENQELDLFIFGFWGHGVFCNGQRYFCPSNVMDDAIEKMGGAFSQLQSALSNIRAKNTCLILDCCQKTHDRGVSEVLTSDDQNIIEKAVRDIVQKRKEQIPGFQSNVAILNSCDNGQSAYEWDERKHGIFTAHLLDAMNRRLDSVSKIVSYISSNIGKTTLELGKTQTPFYSLKGDIPLPVDTKSSPLITGDVFISYRHCNVDIVTPVEEEFIRRDISYFIDREGVNYGMEYSEAITIAILASKLLLLFWTPEVKESNEIVKEVTLAQECNKPVIPYKIGSFKHIEHTKLCYHVAHLSRYEVPQQTPETIKELVNRVEQTLLGKPFRSKVTFILPDKSEDAVIEKPVIEDIEVSFTPEQVERKTIQTGAIQLPPIPKELLDIKAENRGLQTAIEQLQSFTHESLAQANDALEQAQAQFQAWKERKEKSWKNMSQDLRQSLEDCISNNPNCTEEDIDAPLGALSYQEYFDLIEQFQCGKKCEQAWRELERVELERQMKCDKVVAKIKKQIEDNYSKIKDVSDNFFNETLMTILSALSGYNKLNASFPDSQVIPPLRQLEEYGLGWNAKATLSQARRLWNEQRPCILEHKEKEREQEAKKHDLSIPGTKAGERKTVILNDVEYAFRWCPPGAFMMGYENKEQHQVTLTKGFWMMETQVTQKQWEAILGNNPSNFKGEDLPVENISWNDCQLFCKKCSELGLSVQLPTEAQWEYACRAGSTSTFFWGYVLFGDKANCNGHLPCGTTHKGNNLEKTTPVGSYKPNAWGLYDMHGNVNEWCQDWYGEYPGEDAVDPTGPSNGSLRVFRGGSWHSSALLCRSALRFSAVPDSKSYDLGFRCVRLIASSDN
ncbi:MAG: SUMF1/EgtB/PvdO family nonheme iron enzyme [Thermoguttaceae bacterium]|nr:SUMF1/EgtB/PvdO family nonheme iron enzyme [Thermoguttaceae bacterium]